MQHRTTPALARALAFIESLRSAGAAPGGRLPTVRRLAALAGVSLRTMHQAVRMLDRAGLLSARQRAGTRWADLSAPVPRMPPPAAPLVRAPRCQRLAAEIESAVLGGALPDPLPSVKELRVRYRAGHAAVAGALAALGRSGALVRRGRQWAVVRADSPSGVSRVVLIAPADTLALFAGFDSKVAEFCTAIERECSIRATSIGFQSAFRPVRPEPSALGYLVVATHQPDSIAAILGALRPAGRPMVVVDPLGDCPLPRLEGLGRVWVVRIQGARFAGRQVALMLRRLGHRRIAYISPYNLTGTTWVGDRLEGLRDVYGEELAAFFGTELDSGGTAVQMVQTQVLRPAGRALAALAESVSKRLGPTDASWLRERLVVPLEERLTESYLKPLFTCALSDPSLTAWACANDHVALSALQFLAGRRVPVPRQISVVGFDGSPEAMLADLTTYDFNAPAVARTALDLVLRPPAGLPGAQPRIFDVLGVLAQRPTVGPVKL